MSIGAAYASATDLNPWLPGAGTPAGIVFAGPREDLAGSLRVNSATSAAIVSVRLLEGDSYTLHTNNAAQQEQASSS